MSFLDGINEDEGVGRATVVPESFYPLRVVFDCCEEAKSGNPGIMLAATVLEGPYAGTDLDKYATAIWVWAPQTVTKAGKDNPGYERQCTQQLGLLKHFAKVMTGGKGIDQTALAKHGCNATNEQEFWAWFDGLDTDLKIMFLDDFLRLPLWAKGQNVIGKVDMQTSGMLNAAGEPLLDENGIQRMRDQNRLVNIFPYNHARYNYAAWKDVHLPQQEQAYKMQFGG